MKLFQSLLLLFLCSPMLSAHAQGPKQPAITATQPFSLAVNVGAGEVSLPTGKKVQVSPARLVFDAPELRDFKGHHKGQAPEAPNDYAPHFERLEPWPTDPGKLIEFSPRYDESNTLILGSLFRTFREDTLRVTSEDGQKTFQNGTDFVFNADHGQIANKSGRLTGKTSATVQGALQRLDLIQVTPDGRVTIKKGQSALVAPVLPQPDANAVSLAGIYLAPWRTVRNPHYDDAPAELRGASEYAITPKEILPVKAFNPPALIQPEAVAKTLAKLRAGQPVKVAFMGDSITVGAEATRWYQGEAYGPEGKTYRGRFIYQLRQRFPGATITPIEATRGGSAISYAVEQVDATIAPQKPDLVVVAFGANDVDGNAGRPAKTSVEDFGQQLQRLAGKVQGWGGETIMVTCFPLNPWLKNGAAQRQPQYNEALKAAAKEGGAAVADVYNAYESLTARGIPTWSQLHNWKNHPGDAGHEVYADTLMRFFPAQGALTQLAPTTPAAQTVKTDVDGVRFGITQPATVPNNWETGAQPLPGLNSIVHMPVQDRPVYGVYCWAEEYVRFHDFIRSVGWKSVRLGGPMSDEALKLAARDGMEVMVTVSGSKIGNRSKYDSDSAFINTYVQLVEQFLERWGPGGTIFKEDQTLPNRPVRLIEVWNEPNFHYLDGIKNTGTYQELLVIEETRARLYGALLVATHKAVKARWPEVQIVGFSAGGTMNADGRFIAKTHELNPQVAQAYDILSTHPYVPGVAPEANYVASWGKYSIAGSLQQLRNVLQKHGVPNKPIWYSELNWEITSEEGGRYDGAKARLHRPLQAAFLVRGYAWAMRLGIPRLNYMSLVDTDGVNSGFLNTDATERPAAVAIRTMTRLMPQPKLTGAISDGVNDEYIYRFIDDTSVASPKQREIVMAWRVGGPKFVEIPWGQKSVQVTDMLGATQTFSVTGGKFKIEIGSCPLYLRAP